MTPYRIAFSVIVDAEGIDKGDAVNRAKMALGWSNPPLHVARTLSPDIVVSASDVRFRQLEIGRGILPFGGATLRAPRQLGCSAHFASPSRTFRWRPMLCRPRRRICACRPSGTAPASRPNSISSSHSWR